MFDGTERMRDPFLCFAVGSLPAAWLSGRRFGAWKQAPNAGRGGQMLFGAIVSWRARPAACLRAFPVGIGLRDAIGTGGPPRARPRKQPAAKLTKLLLLP